MFNNFNQLWFCWWVLHLVRTVLSTYHRVWRLGGHEKLSVVVLPCTGGKMQQSPSRFCFHNIEICSVWTKLMLLLLPFESFQLNVWILRRFLWIKSVLFTFIMVISNWATPNHFSSECVLLSCVSAWIKVLDLIVAWFRYHVIVEHNKLGFYRWFLIPIMRDDAFSKHLKLALFWCLVLAGASLTYINGAKTTMLESTDCSRLESKSRCESMNRACDWRVKGFVSGGTCENKFDTIYDGNIEPFIRKGRRTTKTIKANQHSSFVELDHCIAPVISDLGNEPCYALSFKNIDECGCNAQTERSYVIPKHESKRGEVRHLSLSKPLLKDHTMFIFIHANKAAGETIKSIAYEALHTNHWYGAALGTRVGWQFLEQTQPLYDFPKPNRRQSSNNKNGKLKREITLNLSTNAETHTLTYENVIL